MHIQTVNIHFTSGLSAINSALLKAFMDSTPAEEPAAAVFSKQAIHIAPRVGQAWPEQGGIYLGVMPGEGGKPDYHLILSDKAGEFKDLAWGGYGHDAPGAKSDNDGLANTLALQASDELHPAADRAADLDLAGFTDWYLPARNELRLAYITAKQHFDTEPYYWSSTQYSGYNAWYQYFDYGTQYDDTKSYAGRVRLVRRLEI